MVPGPSARLASAPVRLKTSLALSLALLLGTAPGVTEAAPRKPAPRGKTSKKKPTPAETPTGEPADAPSSPTQAPAQARVQEPAPEPVPPPPAPTTAAPWAGRVVMFSVPGPSAAPPHFESDLRQAVRAEPKLQWMDPSAFFAPPPRQGLEQAEKLFSEGKELYDNLDTEAAAKRFATAVDYYRQHGADAQPERLARVCIFLGATRLLNGDTPGAQEAFINAQLAAPGVKPESDLFGQDVHDAFTAARNALARKPKGTLAIESEPAGAHVSVHGEYLGLTPLKDVELPPGPHQVVLTLPGYEPLGIFQDIQPAQRTVLHPELKPLPGLAEARDVARQVSAHPKLTAEPPPPGVATLSQQFDARYVVLVVGGQPQGSLYAWDARGKSRLSGVKLDPRDPQSQQKAVGQVQDFLTGKPLPGSGPLSLPPVMKKPWFWAAVGGVAVATTAGVLLATQSNGPVGTRLGNFGTGW